MLSQIPEEPMPATFGITSYIGSTARSCLGIIPRIRSKAGFELLATRLRLYSKNYTDPSSQPKESL